MERRLTYRIATSAAALGAVLFLLPGPLAGQAHGARDCTVHQLDLNGEPGEALEVIFNPHEFTIEKSTPWKEHHNQGRDNPRVNFQPEPPVAIEFEAFLDTYEMTGAERDVREFTEPILRLTQQGRRNVPGFFSVQCHGGPTGSELVVTGFVENAKVRFTQFRPDGVPIRAKITTSWREYKPTEQQRKAAPRH